MASTHMKRNLIQLCLTLCNPMVQWTLAGQAPLPMRILQPSPLPGDLPYPGIELSDPGIKPVSPALQADSLPSGPPGKPKKWLILGDLRILLTDSDVFIFHFVFYLCLSSSLKYKPLKRRSACMRYENSFDYSYFCER